MAERQWRTWGFWIGPVCTAVYFAFLLFVVPYVIYASVQDGFTKEEQLVLVGGMFVLASVPISIWLIYQHLVHFNRPNLQKPIIRILWMVPIYALNAWLGLLLPGYTIYLDSVRECYEAYVIYNFMVYLLEALCMEMDLHAVMREKPQVHHYFPFCCLRNWDMGTEFVFKCKHGILQYAFFQPIITIISVICELCDVYGKGTIGFNIAYPYLVVVTNISQSVAMYCLVLFYLANKNDLRQMRPFPKFACIKAVIFFSFFQGMVINILVYFKVIKNIFGTNETDDYQILSEKLQNFLLCVEMVIAAVAHHYSYPYSEHRINIPNHRRQNGFREIMGSMLDVNDICQDVREHWGAVVSSVTRPFRRADPFAESKSLLVSSTASQSGSRRGSGVDVNHQWQVRGSGSRFSGVNDGAVAGPSKYGTVDFMSSTKTRRDGEKREKSGTEGNYYHFDPPQSTTTQFGNVFLPQRTSHPSAASTSRESDKTTVPMNLSTCRKSESSNISGSSMATTITMSGSIGSDVVNFEVKGPGEDLIQLKESPEN